MIGCTGISAGWCPICGDCCCPVNEHGENVTMDGEEFGRDNPACPLHSPTSQHGEIEVVTSLWGEHILEANDGPR